MSKFPALTIAALALTGALATGPALAAPLQWSVQIGIPLPVPVLPVPVVRQPVPVYVEPGWHYGYEQQRYEVRRPPPPAWRDRDRDGIPDWRDRYDNRRPPPGWRGRGPDRDHDGRPDWRPPRW